MIFEPLFSPNSTRRSANSSQASFSIILFRLVFIVLLKPVIRGHTLSILTLEAHISFSIVCILSSLLDGELFICINLAIRLIVNWRALTANTLRNSSYLRCLYHTLIVIHPTNAVIVCITNVNFDISTILIVQRWDTTRLIEASLESGLVDHSVFAIAQPAKDFVAEWIHDFDLVIVRVCYNYDVLLRNKVDSKRVLKFRIHANAILISIGVQIAWICVPTYEVPSTFQSLHIHGTDARRLWIGNI